MDDVELSAAGQLVAPPCVAVGDTGHAFDLSPAPLQIRNEP